MFSMLDSKITITSLNTKSIRSDYKWFQMESFLQNNNPDICLFQETNITELPKIMKCNQYSFFLNDAVGNYSGTTIAVKKNPTIQIVSNEIIYPAYSQKVTLLISQEVWHIYTVYLPHNQLMAREILDSLSDSFQNCSSRNEIAILGGDFNCTLDPDIDRFRSDERHVRTVEHLRQFVNTFELHDCWRHFYKTKGYTFVSSIVPYSASRIDRLYCSEKLLNCIGSTYIRGSFSDHLAVSGVFKTKYNHRPYPPYWKFDNLLLEDPNFTECMRAFLDDQISSMPSHCDLLEWWDSFKIDIKHMAILYIRQRKKTSEFVLNRLHRQIMQIFTCENSEVVDLTLVNQLLQRVRDWYHSRSEKVLLKSKYEYLIHSDRPCINKHAFRNYKSISMLRKGRDIIEQPMPLCAHVRSYFLEKHSERGETVDEDSVLFENLGTLSSDNKSSLDEPITSDELTQALMSLNKNSAPGIDGLTVEFYKHFWSSLKIKYHHVIDESLRRQTLPTSATKSVVSLLPKKGDLLSIENWRPISVLTTDYKIIAKAVSTRLSQVISTIVDPDQSYAVPGRTIYDNLHLYRDVITYANQEDIPLAILNLDQKSAFDKVCHNYLFHLLKLFNFGDQFVNTVRTLYENATFHVRVGSLLTGTIPFKNGIRQGCPLSGPLYSLTIEPFLNLCRRFLTGFPLPGNEHSKLTTCAYADDVSVFVSNDSDFQKFQLIYSTYSKQSKAELNSQKSRGFWSGKWKSRVDNPLNYSWSNGGIEVLGIRFSNSLEADTQYAVNSLSEKLNQSLTIWKQKLPSASLVGRKIIVNQFVAPKLWHFLHILPFTQTQLQQLQRKLLEFIWMGKHWTAIKDLCLPTAHGGLGLVHLQSKLNLFRVFTASRIVRISERPKWKILMEHFIKKSNPYNVSWQWFFCDEKVPLSRGRFSAFTCSLKEAIQTSGITVLNFPSSIQDLGCFPTTYSKFLIKTVPPLFNELWLCYGFRTISDFMMMETWMPNDVMLQKIGSVSNVISRDMLEHYNRIRLYFELHYGDIGAESDGADVQFIFRIGSSECVVKKETKKKLYQHLICSYFDASEAMTGAWLDDEVCWKSYFNKLTLGFDSEVPWRLAKNRLADPIFLFKAGLKNNSQCPFCPGITGTSWHMIFTCRQVQGIWEIVCDLLRSLLGRVRISLKELYCGYSGRSPAIQLANYIISASKTTIYRVLTSYFRDGGTPVLFVPVFVKKIKSRLVTEFSWYLGKGNLEGFKSQWCIRAVVCDIGDSNQLLFSQLINK